LALLIAHAGIANVRRMDDRNGSVCSAFLVCSQGGTAPTSASTLTIANGQSVLIDASATISTLSESRFHEFCVFSSSLCCGDAPVWTLGCLIRRGTHRRCPLMLPCRGAVIQSGGKLVFADKPLVLTANWIRVDSGGQFIMGDETCKLTAKIVLTFVGARTTTNLIGERALLCGCVLLIAALLPTFSPWIGTDPSGTPA
jgi:hypothetical protein